MKKSSEELYKLWKASLEETSINKKTMWLEESLPKEELKLVIEVLIDAVYETHDEEAIQHLQERYRESGKNVVAYLMSRVDLWDKLPHFSNTHD